MTLKALVIGNTAVNVCDADVLAESFHEDVAAEFVDVPDGVQVGWIKKGNTWSAPPVTPDPPVEPEAAQLRLIPIAQFMLRVGVGEMAAILESAKSDPVVAAVVKVTDALKDIDLNDPSTTALLDLLIQKQLIDADAKARALA